MAASADKTMLSAAKMIAIDDDRTEIGNEGWLFAFSHLQDGAEAFDTVPDKFDGNIGFEVIQFLVNGGEGDGHIVLVHQIGLANSGSAFERNIEHESHECREKQIFFVLGLGGVIEEFVEFFGGKKSLKYGTKADGGGGVFYESVKLFSKIEHRGLRSGGKRELNPSNSHKK
jgi:hypothetical protein